MTTLSQIIPTSLQAKEAEFLTHLSIEELQTRLAKLESMGKATAAKVTRGELGEVEGTHIRKGQRVPTYSAVAALNRQRRAYAQTLCALKAKHAA